MRLSGRYILLCFLLLSSFIIPSSCRSEERVELQLGSELFSLEVADDPEERQQGLMFRDSLGKQEGMIFIFQRDQLLSFWMKNTRIPLSIAYINKSGDVVDILPLIPGDETAVTSSRSVRYAIEVNRGALERAGLDVGDWIDLDPLSSYLVSPK